MADSDNAKHSNFLTRAADRAATTPGFMAHLLGQWGATEGLTWREAARQIGCRDHNVERFALCGRPRASANHFAADIESIASYANVEPSALARFIRQADAVQALSESRPLHDDAAAAGLLIAALDRLQEGDDSTDPA